MTIRKGEPWGSAILRPIDAEMVRSDADLAAQVELGARGPFELAGGDLFRTLGGSSTGSTVQAVPVDVLRVEADGLAMTAVAHVVAKGPGRRGWWRGRLVAVMNVGRRGGWDVAPRAHPNDGRADLVDVAAGMSPRARWQARRRLASGTHVPHPDIRVTSGATLQIGFDDPLDLIVDGVRRGVARSLRVTVEPDACTVYV